MDRLERLRDRAYNQIIQILRFAEEIKEDTNIEDIKGRLDILEVRYQTFNEYEVELFEFPTYKSITDKVDQQYYKARALLTTAISSKGEGRDEVNATHFLNTTLEQFIDQQRTFYEGVNTSQQVRLPKIQIENFSGDYRNWASFHDLFNSTVHNNKNISNVHKLQMLKGLLSGDAASLIRHITITENNYSEAWDKLCSRYNKMTPIVTSLTQTFFDQKPCVQSNGKDLRRITETADEVIRGLRALGPEAETRDPWLIHILLSKIDNESKQLWANESVGTNFPTFTNLLAFLNKRCDALEICDATSKRHSVKPTAKSFLSSSSNNNLECFVCKQQHPLFRCPVFKNQSLDARLELVKQMDSCRNCLKKGHTTRKCFSKTSCLICNKRHHTLLHPSENETQSEHTSASSSHHVSINDSYRNNSILDSSKAQSTNENAHPVKPPPSSNKQPDAQVLHTLYSSPHTVLPTAIIHIRSRTGDLQSFRALLDSGSQTSFVTEHCAQRLGLKRSQSSISIYGLASTSTGKTKGKIDMTIYSRIDKHYTLNVTAHIIGNITSLLPTKPITINKVIPELQLADPEFYKPNKIDVLLGADVFFDVLNQEKRTLDGFPTLYSSKFGWLIAGTWTEENVNINLHVNVEPAIQTLNEDLHQLLKKFWEIEEVSYQAEQTINICEEYYDETTSRDASGKFIVRLPFKEPRPILGRSFEAAHQRLLAMERKFAKMPEFFNAYQSFMNEYVTLGHMTYVPWNEIPVRDDDKYFLPHHAVFKTSSSTTKLRVVFDGSCKTSTQTSLNDILHIGPNLQTDLSTIVIKFRKHAIAMVADIEKMYRQILMNSEDANYQLILWRNHHLEKLNAYKLNTVTYGTACAPYLAVKSLKKSTEQYHQIYPEATETINNEFYIDDLLTGCDSINEAVVLKDQLNEILSKSGFQLRKWKSNSPEFTKAFSPQEIENIPKLIEDDASIKTLGILWNSDTDTFSFKVQQDTNNIRWTKRKILSIASKVYDPLGWLAPIIILFKILLQKMWLLKIGWDACLPDAIRNAWENLYSAIPEVETIQIPRRLTTFIKPTRIQLHAFCDASEAAYGCVIYLRAVNEKDEVSVNIVYAKSKVAPLKQLSLPRLELCGAVLLCNSVKYCIKSLAYKDTEVFAWTDSMIVLHWLSDFPRRWKSFVGNRTSLILETIPRDKWYHIESKHNPADVISRGSKPKALAKSQIWWHGPHWLVNNEQNWPKSTKEHESFDNITSEERQKYTNVLTLTTDVDDVVFNLINKFSSWSKIKKIMVFILRFGLKKGSSQHYNRSITLAEMNEAETILLRNVQKTAFIHELTILSKNQQLPVNNQLSSLDPFIDQKGLLRVGGRLRKSSLPFAVKHPVILPKNNLACQLIIREVHLTNMHAGNALTLSIVRSKYWIIGARYTIKHCIKYCVVCIRYRFHKPEQKMADLPAERCTQSRVFSKIGLDYAGPLYIKTSKRRNSPIEKAYVAVFVCLAVKAVHLEVVSSLDTESFLAALKRFVARRGAPEQIWCDNGSNFVGANRELQQIKHQIINQTNSLLISEFILQKSIKFNFNPPHAPHFGGLWESTVKSFKFHLKRVANVNLVFEEMTTLITQIEALLNSRPLCKINDDPADLEILTPAHFLIGTSLTAIPEPALDEVKTTKLSKWQNIQQRLQGFWKQWHRDYLAALQQRNKWKMKTDVFQIDDVVLIREDNLHPCQWMRGRIINLHPGNDGLTRVVTLKTSRNEIKRPITKLVKLVIKK